MKKGFINHLGPAGSRNGLFQSFNLLFKVLVIGFITHDDTCLTPCFQSESTDFQTLINHHWLT